GMLAENEFFEEGKGFCPGFRGGGGVVTVRAGVVKKCMRCAGIRFNLALNIILGKLFRKLLYGGRVDLIIMFGSVIKDRTAKRRDLIEGDSSVKADGGPQLPALASELQRVGPAHAKSDHSDPIFL